MKRIKSIKDVKIGDRICCHLGEGKLDYGTVTGFGIKDLFGKKDAIWAKWDGGGEDKYFSIKQTKELGNPAFKLTENDKIIERLRKVLGDETKVES